MALLVDVIHSGGNYCHNKEGNKQFYDRVSKLVREGVEHGTVEGKELVCS